MRGKRFHIGVFRLGWVGLIRRANHNQADDFFLLAAFKLALQHGRIHPQPCYPNIIKALRLGSKLDGIGGAGGAHVLFPFGLAFFGAGNHGNRQGGEIAHALGFCQGFFAHIERDGGFA